MSAEIKTNWRAEAEVFYRAGLRVIPFRKDEHSNFVFPSWHRFLEGDAEEMKSERFWSSWTDTAEGLALLMTDDLEALDIDAKADPNGTICKDYLEAVERCGGSEALSKCIGVTTKSKGFHFVYRAKNRQGNQKLASRPNEVDGRIKPETLVETRGKGGLLFIAPTKGYKVHGEPYTNAQYLTDSERNLLIQAGRMCDRMPDVQPEVKREQRAATKSIPKGDGITPWDAFNESMDVLDMLEQLGWTIVNQRNGYVRVNRPGHTNPRDIGGSVIIDANMFYPFTSSTKYQPNRAYTPFAVYAYETHNGDFSEAAKALYADGFGDRRGAPETQKLDGSRESLEAAVEAIAGKKESAPVDAKDELQRLLDEVDSSHTFDINAEMESVDFVMFYTNPETGEEVGISALGMFGLMVGLQKSGKTTLLIAFVVAALTGKPYLNFRFDLKGKTIVWLDCEQPKFWFQLVCQRVYRLAGLKDNSPRFRAVSLRRYSKAQRAALTGALILREDNLGLALIDGLVDICQNFNEVEHSETTIDKVLEWSDKSGALVMGVIHLTKGMGYIKGHLGTIAQNKCDFALETSKGNANGEFNVKHREARGKAIEDFTFYRNDKGDPVTSEQYEAETMTVLAAVKSNERGFGEPVEKPYGTYEQMSLVETEEVTPF